MKTKRRPRSSTLSLHHSLFLRRAFLLRRCIEQGFVEISKAEKRLGRRYLNLQRRIIEELANWKLRGPMWEVERPG